ncbi:glycosyltransferase [Arthrobacter sp. H14-L1]|uniref:glycosyltransferase n=1 Tax=Arthrobacter sp. H14-L1 TaxID=2996697 RepID=UPI002270F4B1|nr:glycosyltransferase [Arthrobacter sp. H14-L1]MCY0905459.1 glycosyltransferase [Arthrobacter sp. H14-L1]
MAIVPIHNPNADILLRLRLLRSQVGSVVIVDDGSIPAFESRGLEEEEGFVILHQNNRGIASAINAGILTAFERWPHTDFVLTVDQDSQLVSCYLENALATFERARADGIEVGAVCAEQFNDWKVTPLNLVRGHRQTLQVAQSGMLFPRATLDRFGLFDTELFIDCVDTVYALKMLQAGSMVIMGKGCIMAHEVGVTLPLRFLARDIVFRGRVRRFSYHSALRRYYISRNRAVVLRRYFWVSPIWELKDTVAEARTAMLSIIFGPRKQDQIIAIVVGVMDAIRGRMGKASQSRERSLGAAK